MILKCIIFLSIFSVIYEINGQKVCPECICPVEYEPICAKQEVTNKLRGFSSLCVMNCSNQCRPNKFVFEKKGRCGANSRTDNPRDKPVTKPTRPPRPTKRPNRILFG